MTKPDETGRLPGKRNALTFDANEYLHFLNGTGWTDEQKLEFTKVLWEIIVGFVDLGFGLNSVQLTSSNESLLELDSPCMLDSMDTSKLNDRQDVARGDERVTQEMDS